MLIVKIWNFLRGYVNIKIEGLALEKFINYAISKGVYLWDIQRIDYTTLEAKVGLGGYKELRHIIKKAGCRVKIRRKIGYPFFVHKIKRRKMFSMGFVVAIVLVVLGSSFVWRVDIVGNEEISTDTIEELLIKNQLYPGVFKYNLDTDHIENSMMIELEQLAWVGINLKGTRVIVDIVEKVNPPERLPLDVPCDIVAAKNGIVEKIIAKNGDAVVSQGSVVKKGDPLITGVLRRENMPDRYVHALGEVYGRTFYEAEDEISLVKHEKIRTGKMYKRRILKIGSSQISLSFDESPFTNVIMEKKVKSLPLWRNIKIPVELITEEYYQVVDKSIPIEKEVAKKALQEKIMVKIINTIPINAEIIDEKLEFIEENEKIRAVVTIEALEQIGIQRKILPFE